MGEPFGLFITCRLNVVWSEPLGKGWWKPLTALMIHQ